MLYLSVLSLLLFLELQLCLAYHVCQEDPSCHVHLSYPCHQIFLVFLWNLYFLFHQEDLGRRHFLKADTRIVVSVGLFLYWFHGVLPLLTASCCLLSSCCVEFLYWAAISWTLWKEATEKVTEKQSWGNYRWGLSIVLYDMKNIYLKSEKTYAA